MSDRAHSFYRQVMKLLDAIGVPWLVGGAFALRAHTGIVRDTKDFDILLQREHLDTVLTALDAAGFSTERTHPHWLAKARHDGWLIDMIYNSGNGLCAIESSWFEHALPGELWDRKVLVCPAEELIWQKIYIMERERFDGADVMHLMRACAGRIDWARLLRLVGPDWRVLFAHVMLFEFIYPGERHLIPMEVRHELLRRYQTHSTDRGTALNLCYGTLLSRATYLYDLESLGYGDARKESRCAMNTEDIKHWTDAIPPPEAAR
jgi:hypothetical protein